jgi:hypothetical protein
MTSSRTGTAFADPPPDGVASPTLCAVVLDIALACAPLAVALPAAVAVLSTQVSYATKGHSQKRLYGSLLLAEKLPRDLPGGAQISRDIDRQTLHLAYVAQYPHRATEIAHIALIGGGLVASLVAYYCSRWAGGRFVYQLAFLAMEVLAALWFVLALRNFAANDNRCRALFETLRAPVDLVRPDSDLFRLMAHHDADVTLRRAAEIRDRRDSAMTTVDAVNAALTLPTPAGRHAWDVGAQVRDSWPQLRARTKTAQAHGLRIAATSYDWLLDHLLGPFFKLRLANIDHHERHRIAKAEKTGDVYRTAWLSTYYRAERDRVAEHWRWLHRARDPLLRWAGEGKVSTQSIRASTITAFAVGQSRRLQPGGDIHRHWRRWTRHVA